MQAGGAPVFDKDSSSLGDDTPFAASPVSILPFLIFSFSLILLNFVMLQVILEYYFVFNIQK